MGLSSSVRGQLGLWGKPIASQQRQASLCLLRVPALLQQAPAQRQPRQTLLLLPLVLAGALAELLQCQQAPLLALAPLLQQQLPAAQLPVLLVQAPTLVRQLQLQGHHGPMEPLLEVAGPLRMLLEVQWATQAGLPEEAMLQPKEHLGCQVVDHTQPELQHLASLYLALAEGPALAAAAAVAAGLAVAAAVVVLRLPTGVLCLFGAQASWQEWR